MQFSMKLLSLLHLASLGLASPLEQKPIQLTCVEDSKDFNANKAVGTGWGWRGPGLYQIANRVKPFQLSVDPTVTNGPPRAWKLRTGIVLAYRRRRATRVFYRKQRNWCCHLFQRSYVLD
ncbi:MAG: hypothetical protein M1829_006566 [Trizodia sp. TS-e1964]|nr:MAG: hypothetical protein M1829_006566 [Trizodia sp. TS-e1964]